MQKTKVLVALFAVIFGVFIVASSLVVSSEDEMTNTDKESERKFYVSKRILPDHILYPVLMAIDKGLLMVATGESEIFLRIRLAQDRMLSAQALLQKGEETLALSTLTKSQKYLIIATQQFLSSQETTREVGVALLQALQENTQNLRNSQVKFSNIPTGPISDLIIESESLIAVVEGKVQ